MESKRLKRINRQLLREISSLILREFPHQLITVQTVKTSPDLKSAKIGLSFLNFKKEDEENFIKNIQSKARFFQNILAKKLKIKFIPKIEFFRDSSSEIIDRINKILVQDQKTQKGKDVS